MAASAPEVPSIHPAMKHFHLLAALPGLGLLLLVGSAAAQKPAKPKEWTRFPGGLEITLAGSDWVVRSTLGEEELKKVAARIAELRPFYEVHFGTKLPQGWSFTVLADMGQYNTYARETTHGVLNVQGQCLRDRKEVALSTSKRYGWESTLSHEFAHAYYDYNGPIWLREGVASLVEVAVLEGKEMKIPVNQPRRNGLGVYQQKGHYLSIQKLLRGEPEADGYGYSYEHGWSVHWFLYNQDAAKYRAFLTAVKKKNGPDVSADVAKAFGMDLETLDARWKESVAKLK